MQTSEDQFLLIYERCSSGRIAELCVSRKRPCGIVSKVTWLVRKSGPGYFHQSQVLARQGILKKGKIKTAQDISETVKRRAAISDFISPGS
jgi:hypothetical protein